MDGGGEQQRGDRRVLGVGVPVREDDQAGAVLDRGVGLGADLGEAGREGVAAAGDPVQTGEGRGLHAGHVAVGVDVDELGQLVVVDHREGQGDATTGSGRRLQQVARRAERGTQAGDQLFADRVQRRVGDLREQLGEVVEEQPRAGGQRGDRRVGAHRTDRLRTGLGHRREDDAQLLLGVAEGLLAAGDRGVGVHDVLTLGQVGELDLTGFEPVAVRLLGGEAGLDLVVLDDAVLGGVHEEHAAGLEAALADDLRGVDVEDADLGAEDDQALVGDPVTAGAQAVAVEDRADLGAVGEGDAGRAVPGLHHRGVELVEGAAGRVHGVVVLPRLRDHHQHRVRQRTPAQVQEFEHLVEGRGVGGVRRADREDAVELVLVAEEVGDELGLAGRHPVAVALDRVDLAVVRDEAVRVGERPRREGVRGEPGVHERDRGGEAPVGQVREEGLQLTGGEHALVDDGPRGERREVDAGLALGALAQREGLAVEVDALALPVAHEELTEEGHGRTGRGTEEFGRGRHLAPSENREALLGDDRLNLRDGRVRAVHGQEGDTDRVTTGGGQIESGHLAEEGVRHLGQDARAVARVGLGTGRTAVLQVAQHCERLLDQRVARLAGEGGHEADATGVVLVTGVVHTLRGRASIHEGPVLAIRGVLGRLARRTHRLSRRRRDICVVHRDDAGPLRSECKISCRLHDGAVLGNRILRSNMRTPQGGGAAPHRRWKLRGPKRTDRCPSVRGRGSVVAHPAGVPQASLPTALTAHARWLSVRNQRVTATYATHRISARRAILRPSRTGCPGRTSHRPPHRPARADAAR